MALTGDPRNDENLIVSQLHLAFLKFHNAVVNDLRAGGTHPADLFDEAQRRVRWHYQWLLVHHFLSAIVDPALVAEVRDDPGARKIYK